MFIRPRNLEEAVRILATEGGVPLAGGTDLYPGLVDRSGLERFVDLSRLAEIRGIAVDGDCVRIGGATRWSEIAAARLPSAFDGLRAAARDVGSVQIQNAGTIAGNLCNASPAADGVPPLLALDAEVELVSVGGKRRLGVAQFVRGNRRTDRRPDEIVSAIVVPRRHETATSVFRKLGARRYLVISIAMVAVNILRTPDRRLAHVAVAVGAASETARRMTRLEAKLRGAPAGAAMADMVTVADLDLSPIDDVRATAAYRLEAAATLVRRAVAQAEAGAHA